MYCNKGDFETAKIYLDSCYWQIKQADTNLKNYYVEHKRAILLTHDTKHEEALAIFNEVVETMKVINPGFLTIIYTDIGNVYRSLSEYEKSLEAYQKALNIFELHKRHTDHLPKVYAGLAEANYELGNYKVAYEMSAKRAELDFELFDSRSERNSYLMNVQDDFRLYKEEEQKRVRKQELAQLKQHQRLLLFQRLLLVASLLFLSLLGIIYFRLQKGKIAAEKALNHQLKQQNLEKEQFLKRIEKKNEELMTFSNIMA